MNEQDQFDAYIREGAERYVAGLQKAGLQPNDTLNKAVAERLVDGYIDHLSERRDARVEQILSEHERRMKELKCSGARVRMILCPPLILAFGLIAWYSFNQGQIPVGITYALASLAFLCMFVVGAIFERKEP